MMYFSYAIGKYLTNETSGGYVFVYEGGDINPSGFLSNFRLQVRQYNHDDTHALVWLGGLMGNHGNDAQAPL